MDRSRTSTTATDRGLVIGRLLIFLPLLLTLLAACGQGSGGAAY